ncbi:hypothetical protein CEXT_338331 [Caerostris extrusa]|uniref:Uncharacterized protein n=1 Tax=Caerostris extrusa TaxID=172846 RepID=A0AAV4XKJ2_CAEEX|nr:hypothetical protein CEXT_338331 [Caerostris extrusa]
MKSSVIKLSGTLRNSVRRFIFRNIFDDLRKPKSSPDDNCQISREGFPKRFLIPFLNARLGIANLNVLLKIMNNSTGSDVLQVRI